MKKERGMMGEPTEDLSRRLSRMQTHALMLEDFVDNGMPSDNGRVPASAEVLQQLAQAIRSECQTIIDLYALEVATPKTATPLQSKSLH